MGMTPGSSAGDPFPKQSKFTIYSGSHAVRFRSLRPIHHSLVLLLCVARGDEYHYCWSWACWAGECPGAQNLGAFT